MIWEGVALVSPPTNRDPVIRAYRDAFAPMLRARTAPKASSVAPTVTAHAVS